MWPLSSKFHVRAFLCTVLFHNSSSFRHAHASTTNERDDNIFSNMLSGSCRCLGVGATHTTPPLPTMSIPTSSSSKRAGTSTSCDRHCITFFEDEPSGAHCSSSSSAINRTATTRASAKKYVKEYLCFKCGGDVRRPPLPHSQSRSTTFETKTTIVACENQIVEDESHSSEPFVVCALGCSSPRYHVRS